MNVFVVEDDRAVRESLAMLLRQMGRVVRAYDSAEAFLSAARPKSADTVLIDVGLPGMSGGELMRCLGSDEAGPRVIFLSGQSRFDIDAAQCPDARAQVLRKPFNADALAEILGPPRV